MKKLNFFPVFLLVRPLFFFFQLKIVPVFMLYIGFHVLLKFKIKIYF